MFELDFENEEKNNLDKDYLLPIANKTFLKDWYPENWTFEDLGIYLLTLPDWEVTTCVLSKFERDVLTLLCPARGQQARKLSFEGSGNFIPHETMLNNLENLRNWRLSDWVNSVSDLIENYDYDEGQNDLRIDV